MVLGVLHRAQASEGRVWKHLLSPVKQNAPSRPMTAMVLQLYCELCLPPAVKLGGRRGRDELEDLGVWT